MQLIKSGSEELRKAKHGQLPHSVKGSYFRGVTECDSISPQMMSGAELSRGDHIFPLGGLTQLRSLLSLLSDNRGNT